MAHGLPVILPHYGPPLEFVSNDAAFIFPARRYVPGFRVLGFRVNLIHPDLSGLVLFGFI